jgi:hypothetical protein
MKIFLPLIFVGVSVLLTLSVEPSTAVNDSSLGGIKSPIKVLDVKLTNTQSQKDSWLGGLEIQIENTSGKPIQYLMMYAELPDGTSSGSRVPLPLAYGQVFPDSKSGKVEFFQPGARLTLRATKIQCERIKKLVASGAVPSAKELQTNIQVVLFADRTSWADGKLHYPDPVDPKKWIVAEEVVRSETRASELFGVGFQKASLVSSAKTETCYRYAGFYYEYCCVDETSIPGQPHNIYMINAVMTEDPTGNKHPNTQQPCCPGTSDCCTQVWYASGCEQ